MSKILDLFIDLFKWPVALLCAISVPALVDALDYIQVTNIKFLVFLGGGLTYILFKILASSNMNMSMLTLAHELTHAFFALLTFHRVSGIRINYDDSGGSMRFKGRGNWLIVIAPYFFPLFLFSIMLGITFFSDRIPNTLLVNGVLGYFFAYHLESIVLQIHGDQPDFKLVGFPFCILFLPGANLFFGTCVVAFNNGGWVNIKKYIKIVEKLNMQTIEKLLDYFTNWYSTHLMLILNLLLFR